MKWGVRHERDTTGKRTSSQNKKNNDYKKKVLIGAIATAGVLAGIGCLYLSKKNKNFNNVQELSFGKILDLKSMNTNDTVIKAGTKMQRISSKSLEDYTKEGSRIYASFIKKDNRIYKRDMPENIDNWIKKGIIKGDGAYNHTLINKNTIKIPSERKVAEVYLKVTGKDKIDHGEYVNFMTGLVDSEKKQNKKFFNVIKEMGYNAIIDENDAGHYTKKPLILLNPNKDIITSSIRKIGTIEKFINVLLM